MAKRKTKKQAAAGWTERKLTGKTICFGGRWGKYDKAQPLALIEMAGGTVAKQVSAKVDYVLVNSSQSGTTSTAEKQALKLNQAGETSISVINEQELVEVATPDRDEALAMLKSPEGIKHLNQMLNEMSLSIDVSGTNFDGTRLDSLASGCRYQQAGLVIDGCSFRKASLVAAQFSNGKGACFDGADLTKASVDHSSNCSFKNAKLHEANVYVANDCCFDGADLTGANINTVSDCSFKKAICRNMTVNPHSYLYRRGPAKVVNDFTGADLSAACLANASLGGSVFQGVSLQGADLRRCDLSKADLSKADLSGAYLAGADLSGAVLTGADFSDANVQGATFDGANTSVAKNLVIAQQISTTVGPNLKELDKLSKKANNIKAGATVELDDGQVTLSVDGASQYKTYQWQLVRKDGTNDHLDDYDWQGKSYSQVMLELAQFWCTGKLVIESIVAGSSKSPVKGADLRKLVVGAWCEAFGVEAPSEEELKKKKKSQQAGQKEIRDELIEELKSRGGVKKFNARTDAEVLAAGHFRNADFVGKNLSGVKLPSMDLAGAKFEGAKLNKAQLKGCKCGKANFKNANLDGATLQGGSLTGADLSGASLVKANLSGCSLLRTNFTGANLTSVKLDHLDIAGSNFTDAILKGASFKGASFDETTTFPKGFKYPKDMLWAGKGANPLILQQPKEKVGSLTIEDFMQRMQATADKSKLGKSLKMLKADRFQLFVQLEDDSLTGVVKSQSDASLVYSCRLRSDGSFCCCTQNLNVCGGLRGSLCKHLLVLIVGLAQSETIDAATVLNWVKSSRAHKPNLDKDAMSETFLRYKGAEAGEIDWRPTETVPEDFYAL